MNINIVKQLIKNQFPQYSDLEVRSVEPGGHDHHTYHLGKHMSIRIPSHERYQTQVVKEAKWLPYLQQYLNVMISKPLHLGVPSDLFPMHFGIYEWIEGNPITKQSDSCDLAYALSAFLIDLQSIKTHDAPRPSIDNFYRGGELQVYDEETRREIKEGSLPINYNVLLMLWERALSSSWSLQPVFVHGDLVGTNLLESHNQLVGVIDFGGMAVGDPACDLTVAWTLFKGKARSMFMLQMDMDEATWHRSIGWAVWKALLIAHHDLDKNKVKNAILLLQDLIENS